MALTIAGALTVLLLLALDLGVFQRTPREPTFKEAVAWTAVWVTLALAFGAGVTAVHGAAHGAAYYAAYVVEQSLSVDNLLVLIVIFAQLGVPRAAQRKALVAGIAGAFVLRTVLILGGTQLIAQVHAATYALGALLVLAAWKLLRGDAPAPDTDASPRGDASPRSDTSSRSAAPSRTARPSLVERVVRRVLPIARDYDGARFVTREAGRWRFTPLVVAILVIEVTDLVFALDSIPAVLGIAPDPFVALTSNLFAVLGLRSLFFVVSGALARLRHLKTGLVVVLLFVGAKLCAAPLVAVPVAVDLTVILTILGVAIVASLRSPNPEPEKLV